MLDHEKLESIARKHRLPAARWDERLADRGGGAALNAARDALRKCAHKARKRLWGDLETASEELERAFLPLTDAQGQRLCAELFTGLGPAARRIWSDAATRPVTINRGHGRRAFRAPTDAALLAAARADLIKSLVSDLDGIDQDGLWLARHAGLFDDGSTSVSSLLAAAIDQGGAPGAAVRDQLIEAAWARDGVCGPTSVGLVALTLCADDAAHAEVLKLLHSAKREEGLRQRIAENADEAHPALFRRLLAEILDQDYLRFSAFANCADIWFGLNWDSAAQKALTEAVEHARTMLDEPGRCARAVKSGTAQETYFALWVAAYTDLRTALPLIAAAAASPSAEKRCAAIDLLTAAGLELGQELACAALSDADLRVCARAVEYFNHLGEHLPRRIAQPDAVFDACEKLHARVPARKKLPPAVWPWDARELLPGAITKAMSVCRTPATTQRMLRHVGSMQPADRAELIAEVAGVRVTGRDTFFVYNFDETKLTLAAPLSPSVRSLLLHAIGDTSPHPAGIAAIILAKEPLQSDEAERWCELLSRKSSHFRARAIARLTALADGALLALATRLTADKDAQRRAAGVELLRTMVQQKRSADKAAAALKAAPDGKGAPSARAARALDLDAADLSRATCFGLVRTPPVYVKPAAPGRSRPTTLRMTDAAWGAVYAYAKLVATNLDKPASLRTDSADTPLIGEVEYSWDLNRFNSEKPLDQQREDFGLIAEVERWLAGRTAADRDADGLELYRAALYIELFNQSDDRPLICKAEQVQRLARRDRVELKKLRDSHVFWVGHWVMAMTRTADKDRRYLEAVWNAVDAFIADGKAGRDTNHERTRRRELAPSGDLLESAVDVAAAETVVSHAAPELSEPRRWAAACALRASVTPTELAGAVRRIGKTEGYSTITNVAEALRHPITPHDSCAARALSGGAATPDQFIEALVGEFWGRKGNVSDFTRKGIRSGWGDDATVTAEAGTPAVIAATRRIADRIVELELLRGEAPLPSTPFAQSLGYAGGAANAVRCLAALDGAHIRRGSAADDRVSVLSRLIQRTLPDPQETPERFASLCAEHKLAPAPLTELALYAPQWAAHVEHTLGWPGLAEAVWWVHAHTKGNDWTVEEEVLKLWDATIAERTPVPIDDLQSGGVDVAWFNRIQQTLGPKRWKEVYAAAKYACSGVGHKRAQLFADAMTGAVTPAELTARITTKRHQDSIRALGLCPLPAPADGPKARAQILQRYKAMQEIRRTSSKHGGSMLQTSEKRAVENGMDNLARAAGHPDPLRLQWAMEIEQLGDLSKGPMTAKAGDLTVSLSVEDGEAELAAEKKGKKLAAVPPAAKKDKNVAPLVELHKEIRKSGSRVRKALEEAMCRADVFRAGELRTLAAHPVLWPMVQRLLFIAPTGAVGYPDNGGRTLRDHAARHEPLKDADELRLAHPHDLYSSKQWHLWQRDCFAAERVQPFKQVFRELYLPTATEGPKATGVTRYAGHQVQPRQALALLGTRGWVARPEEGVFRSFHAEKVVAWVQFMEGFYSPADVEGLTVERIHFTSTGKWEHLPLEKVPSRIFSEVMRDLDLVVSVAHRGGVDPETSESTVESRGALIRETAVLLGLKNVKVEKQRAFIDGSIRPYTVHLGSGVVHMMPGSQVWIVPVHAAHRGRIFLPFADSDPKTAEVVSKVLLLARDSEIKDPTIVNQLRA